LKIIQVPTDDDLELAIPLLLPNNVNPSKKYLQSLKNKFLFQSSNQLKEPEHFVKNTNSLLSFHDLLKKNYDNNQKDIFSVDKSQSNALENTIAPHSFSETIAHGVGSGNGIQVVKNHLTKNNYPLTSSTSFPNVVPHYDTQLWSSSADANKNTISPTVITQQNLLLNKHLDEDRHLSTKKTSNIVSSTESSATAIPVNTTEILQWIKDLANSIGNAKNSSNIQANIINNGKPLEPSNVVSSLSRPELAESNTDTRVVVATTTPVTTTPRTDRYIQVTTTTARTIASVINNVLSQSVVPLAGFSAATLAYGAAATLPVWLPLALGKKKRRRKRSSLDTIENYGVFLKYIHSPRDLDS
jgi:hypothetical protein